MTGITLADWVHIGVDDMGFGLGFSSRTRGKEFDFMAFNVN